VVVPRFGRTAVERNVVKRRLRDLARTELLPTLGMIDVVIRASPGAYAASYDTLREIVRKVALQLPRTPGEEVQ
jgi:ribonuclease P protein component